MGDGPTGGPVFTVFTPTFNRAHTLSRVHDSLRAQTFRDFEWLVVDDGSTDGTAELVRRWAVSSPFPIRYVYQPNAGKAAATNRGVREARGELFLIADSDDAYVPTALERFHFHWRAIPHAERHRFTGVTALCCDEHGRPIGDRFPRDPTDSDSIEIFYRYRVRGEKWGFHRTAVLREFPFPVEAEARHVPEDVVWRAVARRYRTRFVNEVLRVYHQGAGEQLTRIPPRRWAVFRGYDARRLCEDRRWLSVAPLTFYRFAVQYARLCFLSGEGVRLQVSRLAGLGLHLLWATAAVPGLALAARDRWRERAASAGPVLRAPPPASGTAVP